MVSERTRRDLLLHGAALIAILAAGAGGLLWLQDSISKEVAKTVNATLPEAVTETVTKAVDATVPTVVGEAIQPLREDVAKLKGEVEVLKVALARTSENPAVAAVLFPDAPWVAPFVTWSTANPNAAVPLAINPRPGEAWQGESWAELYREWYGDLISR